MVKEQRNDLRINGNGSTSGGKYNDVVINGMGKVNGDLECSSFRCNGESKISGSVKTTSAKIHGSTSIKGNLKSDEIKISGYTGIGGSVDSKSVLVAGQADIGGSLSTDDIEIKGAVKAKGDCSAENFVSHGAFTIDGLLNAGQIEIKLYGPCKAKEIGGETITVKKGNAFILKDLVKSIFSTFDIANNLTADVIEGDDVTLEYTNAKIVRGNNVSVGEGCQIDLVEYRKSFNKSDSSKVKENKKI